MPPAPDCFETPRSRRFRQDFASATGSREFVVRFTSDYEEARDLVAAAAPFQWGTMDRKSIEGDSLGAPDLWMFIVEYGAGGQPGGLRPDQFHVKIGSAQVHITQSRQNLYRFGASDTDISGVNLTAGGLGLDLAPAAPDATVPVVGHVGQSVVITGGDGWEIGSYEILSIGAGPTWLVGSVPAVAGTVGGQWHLSGSGPNCQGAIGVTLDTVQGCDIRVPLVEMSFAKRELLIDDAWVRKYRSFVGKVNRYAWKGYPAGTQLYLGCEPTSPVGSLADVASLFHWNFAHSFLYEPDVTNVAIGSITLPRKGGHEYLWARYVPVPIDGRALVMQPDTVYVERVCESCDFGELEIL